MKVWEGCTDDAVLDPHMRGSVFAASYVCMCKIISGMTRPDRSVRWTIHHHELGRASLTVIIACLNRIEWVQETLQTIHLEVSPKGRIQRL